MTYAELLKREESRGANLSDVAIGRMMDIVGEDTGKWPNWTDEIEPWILELVSK